VGGEGGGGGGGGAGESQFRHQQDKPCLLHYYSSVLDLHLM